MPRTIICFHVYIILDFPITYRNVAMLRQSECACLNKTVNMVVFFLKMMKIPTKKKGDQYYNSYSVQNVYNKRGM